MASNSRKFTFLESEDDGVIKAEDEDGYPVELDLNRDIATKHQLSDGWKAGWEDVVCPILVKKALEEEHVFKPDGEEDDVSMRIAMDFHEAAQTLMEAVEQEDIETSAVGDIDGTINTKTPERNARVILEYLIENDVVSLEGNEVVIFDDPDEEVTEGELTDAGDATVDYFLTWTGYLDRLADKTRDMYELVDENVERMETELNKLETENQKLEKEIQEARQELFNLTGGEMIQPKRTDANGLAVEAPEEIENKRRYKRLYNRVISKKRQLRNINFDEAREQLTEFLEEAKDTEEDIERQVDRLRTYVGIIEALPNPSEVLPQQFFDNILDSQTALQTSMTQFITTSQQTTEMTAETVFGVDEAEEDITEVYEPAQEEVREAEEIDEEQEEYAEQAFEEAGVEQEQDMLGTDSPPR